MALKVSGVSLTIPAILEIYSGPGLLARKAFDLTLDGATVVVIQPDRGGIATHYKLLDGKTDEDMTVGPLLLKEEIRFGEPTRIPAFMEDFHEAYGDPIAINRRAVSADETVEITLTLRLGIS